MWKTKIYQDTAQYYLENSLVKTHRRRILHSIGMNEVDGIPPTAETSHLLTNLHQDGVMVFHPYLRSRYRSQRLTLTAGGIVFSDH